MRLSKRFAYDVKSELIDILKEDQPFDKLMSFFTSEKINEFPELAKKIEGLHDMKQPEKYHAFNVLEHILRVVSAIQRDNKNEQLTFRLAALMHDLGKKETRKTEIKDNKESISYHDHQSHSLKHAEELLPHFGEVDKNKILNLVQHHEINENDLFKDNQVNRSALDRWIRKVGPENAVHLLEFRIYDKIGQGKNADTSVLKKLIDIVKEKISQPVKQTVVDPLREHRGPALSKLMKNKNLPNETKLEIKKQIQEAQSKTEIDQIMSSIIGR